VILTDRHGRELRGLGGYPKTVALLLLMGEFDGEFRVGRVKDAEETSLETP
jgi:hypothetical protein